MFSGELYYTLLQPKSCFNKQLFYLGTTYYEGYEVYEHLGITFNNLFGLPINRVELFFLDNRLVGVSYFLFIKSNSDKEVVHVIEDAFQKDSFLIERDLISLTTGNKIFIWDNEDCYFGLLNDLERDHLFIHYANRNSKLFW
jgi:hypothetical protein